MKHSIKAITCILALPAASRTYADWALVDDLENGLDKWAFSNRISLNNQDTDPLDGSWIVVDRPYDDQGGKALAVSEGQRAYNIVNVGLPLGDLPNTEGAIYTVYFEVAQPYLPAVRSLGLTTGTPDEWFVEDPLNPGTFLENMNYGSYSVVHRVGKNDMNTRNADGTGYAAPYATAQAIETWYRFWMVVDPWLYTWDLYVQGGEFTEQTKVTTEVDTGYTWRNITEDHLRTLWIRTQGNDNTSTSTGAPTYIDNVFVDLAAANLTEPPIESGGGGFGNWGPFPILDAAGNVDTGAWMGYLNVASDPWIWSYSLNQWLYIDKNSVTGSGSWAYVFNL